MRRLFPLSALALIVALAAPARAQSASDTTAAPAPAAVTQRDTLRFRFAGHDHGGRPDSLRHALRSVEWLQAPIGDRLLDDPAEWTSISPRRAGAGDLTLDYNRVDQARIGVHLQRQRPLTMLPRIGARLEYAMARKRTLYGIQVEQPLLPTARFVFGFGMVRRTEHPELQQVGDDENALALLFARTDHRDYFEREGSGVYLSWRVPDFSTVSVHARRDQWRSLSAARHVVSWFNTGRALRANPAIDDGESHRVLVRLERFARHDRETRAGLYHFIELDRSGGALGGDFDYTRLLADVRSVLRLSPASTLALRGVVGSTTSGTLPSQKRFAIGGVDGLRAHTPGSVAGGQVALAQAEWTFGLWALRDHGAGSGLSLIAFTDAGAAWDDPSHRWSVADQRFAVDGGFGVAASDDAMRLYVARDLSAAGSPMVWSLRLHRPF
ncbi:MAG: hypothetical protein RL760_1521 [Candidatus Eisenbacteria bacterium]